MKLTIKDFPIKTMKVHGRPYITYISRTDIKKVMGPDLYEKYCKWARGQTCLLQGDYPWDVEQFLKGGEPLD